LLKNFSRLRKPKTNFQIYQKNILIKYSILLLFLRENYCDIFVEICNVYSETMAKVYYFNLKTYVS